MYFPDTLRTLYVYATVTVYLVLYSDGLMVASVSSVITVA